MLHDNDSPLSYQMWLNRQFNGVKLNYEVFAINEDLPPGAESVTKFTPEMVSHIPEVETVIQGTKLVLQPDPSPEKRCSMLLLNNMLYPEVIMVDCKAKLAVNRVLCKQFKRTHFDRPPSGIICDGDSIQVSDLCYTAFYMKKGTSPMCQGSTFWNFNITKPSVFRDILESMTIIQRSKLTYITLPRGVERDKCKVITVAYSRLYLLEPLPLSEDEIPCEEATGIYHCVIPIGSRKLTDKLVSLSNVFLCDDGTYISSTFLCNDIIDCANAADEYFCSAPGSTGANNKTRSCQYKHETKGFENSACVLWLNKEGLFRTYTKENNAVKEYLGENYIIIRNTYELLYLNDTKVDNKTENCVCNNNSTIPMEFVDDTIPDCPQGEDEPQYRELLLNFTLKMDPIANMCEEPTMLPCVPGHSKCFKRSNMCLYRRHPIYSHLLFCRNGAHLAECSNFACNGNLKCPGYYCVHISHTCDGVFDCPDGQDELNCEDYTCSGKFKCTKLKRCIHLREICDGVPQCLYGDDEAACDIQTCWTNCNCLNYALHCLQPNISVMDEIDNFEHVYVSLSMIYTESYVFFKFIKKFHKVFFLHINNDHLTSICDYIHKMSLILQLNVNDNKIRRLQKACFASLSTLTQLTIRRNILDHIEIDAFANLTNLLVLDISYNRLHELQTSSFTHLRNLSVLLLIDNPILLLNMVALDKLFPVLKIIQTRDFRICCLEERHTVSCGAKPPWPSSCGNILSKTALRDSLLSITIAVFCLNFMSIVRHILDTRQNWNNKFLRQKLKDLRNGYNMTAIVINFSDVIFSTYLMAIVSVDFFYKGYFSNFERSWRKSVPCHLMSFIYIFSSLLSIFSITFLALTRNRMIVNPIHTSFSKIRVVHNILVVGIISLLILSAAVVGVYRFGERNIFQSNSLCLLVGNLGDSSTIKFMTVFLAVTEFVAILLNIALYVHLLTILFRQKRALAEIGIKDGAKIKMTTLTQLLLVGISNILCWAPGGILNMISLSLKDYSIEALVWVTTVATPLNGIVNPIVFNYSFLENKLKGREKDQKKKENRETPKVLY